MLIAVAASISIVLQMNSYLQIENNANFTLFLGQVMDCIALITMSTRLIVLSVSNNQQDTVYSQILIQNTAAIDVLLLAITENTVHWSDCSASRFLKEDIMPTVAYNLQGYDKFENLYDVLYNFQQEVIVT